MITATDTITNEDGSLTVRVRTTRPPPPKGPLGNLRDEHERTLRLLLDILYDARLSAEERVARIGNSPAFDPVRDGRPAFPWPARPGLGSPQDYAIVVNGQFYSVPWREGDDLLGVVERAVFQAGYGVITTRLWDIRDAQGGRLGAGDDPDRIRHISLKAGTAS